MATDFNKWKVVELKAELKSRGLPQNGLKSDLVARLEEAESGADQVPVEDAGEATEISLAQPDDNEGDAPDEKQEEGGGEAVPEETVAPDVVDTEMPSAHLEAESNGQEPAVVTSEIPEIPPAAKDFAESAPAQTSTDSSSSLPPVAPAEIIQDNQKRKRRSKSPPPSADEVAHKRAKQENEDHGETSNSEPVAGGFEEIDPIKKNMPIEVPEVEMGGGHQDAPPSPATGQNGHPPESDETMDDAPPPEVERIVEPAMHPATSALYIKNFMRPLRPQAVQDHLADLATPPGVQVNDNIVVDFYLDTIRTHAFVVFDSISAASRVRNALHDRVWPDETNRKALWVDFIPPESFNDWVDREQSQGGGRGSTNRYEVVYEEDPVDGRVTAHHQESGGAPPASLPPPLPPQPERRESIPTGPSRGFSGVEGAPLGPRGFQQNGPALHPSRTGRFDEDAGGAATAAPPRGGAPGRFDGSGSMTRTLPVVAFQPVADELAHRRLEVLSGAKSKDPDRDPGKEYKRYFFENGDYLVDRGPEIFLGIRPPHREREHRRQMEQGRLGTGPARRGGGGGPPPHHNSAFGPPRRRNRPPRDRLGVPRGGDRYRGAAASADDRPRFGDDRLGGGGGGGGDRYRDGRFGRF